MLDHIPEIEKLTGEELLSIVLAVVAPSECDPPDEQGLRFDAQRAATELYCRASAARRANASDGEPPRWTTAAERMRSV